MSTHKGRECRCPASAWCILLIALMALLQIQLPVALLVKPVVTNVDVITPYLCQMNRGKLKTSCRPAIAKSSTLCLAFLLRAFTDFCMFQSQALSRGVASRLKLFARSLLVMHLTADTCAQPSGPWTICPPPSFRNVTPPALNPPPPHSPPPPPETTSDFALSSEGCAGGGHAIAHPYCDSAPEGHS